MAIMKMDDNFWFGGEVGGVPELDEINYKYWYRPLISKYSQIKKFKNSQMIDYPDIPINLKEVDIDLDYSKINSNYLKYKINLVLPNNINSPYELLFNNKNAIDSEGKIINPKNKQRIFLEPSEFDLETTYSPEFFDNYVKEKYGQDWKIVSKFKVYKCVVPMDVPYFSGGSGKISDHYLNINDKVTQKFKRWIQYDKAKNWKESTEEFDYKFDFIVKDLHKNRGNAQVVFSWLSIFLHPGLANIGFANSHYYHEVEAKTIEFWIQKTESSMLTEYSQSTQQLFLNNFILNSSTWLDFSKAIGDIEPFKFKINPNEKLIIKGMFFPKVIEINQQGFYIPNVKNLTQLHIKHIE